MDKKQNFQDFSYHQHQKNFERYSEGHDKSHRATTWLQEDTVDAWRHQRIYKLIDPLLEAYPNTRWLTVGDGRYGKDAKYIHSRNCSALPTDISEYLLKEAKTSGYIKDYKVENAESLSFKDNEFDFVLCKDAYHHFPRPMIAFYEMLRVAKIGVILIEPNDPIISQRISQYAFRVLKETIKRLLKKDINKDTYEEIGNYVFPVSRREIEKVALGLNYNSVAFKGINDAYFDGVETEKIHGNGPLYRKTKRRIKYANFLCKLKLMDYGILSAIIIKGYPSDELCDSMIKSHYDLVHLSENPYI